MRRKNRKGRLEGEGRRRGARSIVEMDDNALAYHGGRAHNSLPVAAQPPIILDVTNLGLGAVGP